jgi:hypothetical protein
MIAAILSVCAVLGLAAAYWQSRRLEPPRLAAGVFVLAVGSGLSVAAATLTQHGTPAVHRSAQLRPLATIRHYAEIGNLPLTVVYVMGNVALFVPFGFFLYLALRRLRILAIAVTVAASALLSLTVELLQSGIWSRNTDVDDFILNTLGGLCGALLGAATWQAWLYARRRVERQVRVGIASARPETSGGASAASATTAAPVAPAAPAAPARHPA